MQRAYATPEEFKLELDKLPDLDTFKKDLEVLFALDKSYLTQAEIRKLYFDKAILLPNALATLPRDSINLLKAFRVRLNIDETLEDLDLIRTFSYPTTCFCKTNGRAYLKNKSVFYCSDTFEAAFAESKPVIGDTGYLSIWKINSDRDVNYAAFLSSTIPDRNIWYKTASEHQKQMIEHAKNLGNDKSEQLMLLFDFAANIFITETPPYSLTSWIANSILYEFYGIDFIVYPSFATKNITSNIAFHPNFVDNY